jgi:hypothetical protein
MVCTLFEKHTQPASSILYTRYPTLLKGSLADARDFRKPTLPPPVAWTAARPGG